MRKRRKPASVPKPDSKSEPKPNLKPPQNWQHLLATRVSRFPLLAPVLQPLYRRDGIGLLLLFVGVFMLFAISAPRTIILEDDGLFVSAAWFAGVVHPPGYPLYTILGWLSSHLLPFGEIPWRVHLVSGFMGAVTCVCKVTPVKKKLMQEIYKNKFKKNQSSL